MREGYYRPGSRSAIEAHVHLNGQYACGRNLNAVVVESHVSGVFIVACHEEDEGPVLRLVNEACPVGSHACLVRDYPALLAQTQAADLRAERKRRRWTGWLWRAFYGMCINGGEPIMTLRGLL